MGTLFLMNFAFGPFNTDDNHYQHKSTTTLFVYDDNSRCHFIVHTNNKKKAQFNLVEIRQIYQWKMNFQLIKEMSYTFNTIGIQQSCMHD